jgi:ABC-type Fe3+ transport system permease subunit
MAESMVSVVIAVVLIAFAAILLTHRLRRENRRGRTAGHTEGRFDRRHVWERMRHRH